MKESTIARTYSEQGFVVIKGFLPLPFCAFLKEYFNTLKHTERLEKGDHQVPGSECIYGDPCFDTLMVMSTPMISSAIGIDLLPTYTYSRIYFNKASLLPHKDRDECEHSVTLFLGGEYDSLWPVWMLDQEKSDKPTMCALNVGDMVVYRGNKLLHWRDEFEGANHFQVFMHFVEKDGKYKDKLFDTRPYWGLPAATKSQWTTVN